MPFPHQTFSSTYALPLCISTSKIISTPHDSAVSWCHHPTCTICQSFSLNFLMQQQTVLVFQGFQAFVVICFQKYLFHEVLSEGLIVSSLVFIVFCFVFCPCPFSFSESFDDIMGWWSQQVFCNCWKIAEAIFSVFFHIVANLLLRMRLIIPTMWNWKADPAVNKWTRKLLSEESVESTEIGMFKILNKVGDVDILSAGRIVSGWLLLNLHASIIALAFFQHTHYPSSKGRCITLERDVADIGMPHDPLWTLGLCLNKMKMFLYLGFVMLNRCKHTALDFPVFLVCILHGYVLACNTSVNVCVLALLHVCLLVISDSLVLCVFV